MTTQAEFMARAKAAARTRQATNPQPQPGGTDETPATAEIYWGSILGTFLGMALAAGGIAVAVGATGMASDTKSFWYLSRASGLVAYLLLWASVVWGLLLTTGLGRQFLAAPLLLDAHGFLSNIGLGFAFFHGLILMGDQYLSFPLAAVLVPFHSVYKPILVAAGQIGLWLSLLLILSFYLRRWLGANVWRRLHYASFIGYWTVLFHAVLLGSDSGLFTLQVLYLATAGTVLFLSCYRVLATWIR